MNVERSAKRAQLTLEEVDALYADPMVGVLRSGDVEVLYRVVEENDGHTFWVCFAHGAGFKHYLPQVRFIAHLSGCSKIAFSTNRRGWSRMLGPEWRRRWDGGFECDVTSEPQFDLTVSRARVLRSSPN